MQTFLDSRTPGYVEKWLTIWQPYFCAGQNRAMCQAIADTRPLTSYFTQKSSPSQARLPRGYHTIHDGRDNDEPVDKIQSTMHH
eukprot:5921534-Ditylum_brightwellii.AAC.1